MERILTISLDKNSSKPVFKLQKNELPIMCMFDTGADTPVWCSGVDYFKTLFPDSEKVDGIFLLGGFGSGASRADMYMIPEFELFNIKFKKFFVAMSDKRRFSYDLILSYTLFSKMDYSILNRNQNTPTMKIIFDNRDYFTGIRWHHDKYIQRIYSFTQDDNSND